MAALFVGVDSGGTSTRCVIADETGQIVGQGRAGGANALSVADPTANLVAALRAGLAGLDRSAVVGGVVGLAGTTATAHLAERAWRVAGLPRHPSVVPDILVAFTSATTEPDGTVLIAGTGAVGARVRGWRVVRRTDGLGWLLGDEGSGVWLGRRAVTAALAALDGRGRPTSLVDRVADAVLGDSGPARPAEGPDLVQVIVSAVHARVAESGPAWLGTLAPVADAAARGGDPVARDILREAAGSLGRTVRAVLQAGPTESPAKDAGPLVLAGSLLTEPTELARLVRSELFGLAGWCPGPATPRQRRSDVPVTWVPAGEGAAGAAALALRRTLPPGDPAGLAGHRRLIGQDAR